MCFVFLVISSSMTFSWKLLCGFVLPWNKARGQITVCYFFYQTLSIDVNKIYRDMRIMVVSNFYVRSVQQLAEILRFLLYLEN